jgi:quinol monooxygenase YgiN
MKRTRLAAALVIAVLAALAVPARLPAVQDQPHPIAATVKAALKDTTKPFTLVIRAQVKEGMAEKFEAAFAKAVKPTRQEKGCLAYQLNRQADAPNNYLVYERWKDLAALEAHLKSKHITTLLGEIHELMSAPPEMHVLLPVAE